MDVKWETRICRRSRRCLGERMRRLFPIHSLNLHNKYHTLKKGDANPLYPADYAFRDVYLLAAAADTDKSAMDGAIKGLEGWVACFGKARLAGTVFGGGADAIGTIQGNPALKEAHEMGKRV